MNDQMSYPWTWVAHCSRYKVRRAILEKLLRREGIRAEWCTEEPMNGNHFSDDEALYQAKLATMSMLEGPSERPGNFKPGNLSCAWKHLRIWQHIADGEASCALVLEDDAILEKKFLAKIKIYLEKTPQDWDLIFMGCGANLHVPKERLRPGQVAYLMDPPRSRCSDSYFISRQAAKVISETVQPFSMPIDWELGYQLHLHRMKVYWWEPPLVRQGSETGLYRSEVREEWHHKKMKFKIWRAWESLKSLF